MIAAFLTIATGFSKAKQPKNEASVHPGAVRIGRLTGAAAQGRNYYRWFLRFDTSISRPSR